MARVRVQGSLGRLWKPLLLLIALVLASCAASELNASKRPAKKEIFPPSIQWAQRRSVLYIKLLVPDVDPETVHVRVTDGIIEFNGDTLTGDSYLSEIVLFRRIESRTATYKVKKGEVNFVIDKFWEWKYWPRLLQDPTDPYTNLITVDWKRWKEDIDDEDDVPKGEDPAWWDDDIAARKEAKFTEDDFDNSEFPLLNMTTFADTLENGGARATTVLFFERKFPQPLMRQLYKSFAIIAAKARKVGMSLVAVDIGDPVNVALVKQLRVFNAPTTRVFYPDGGMYEFKASDLGSGKALVQYLARQLRPAYAFEIDSVDKLLEVLKDSYKTLLGIFDREGKEAEAQEAAYDVVAKELRAETMPPPIHVARMDRAVLRDLWEEYTAHVRQEDDDYEPEDGAPHIPLDRSRKSVVIEAVTRLGLMATPAGAEDVAMSTDSRITTGFNGLVIAKYNNPPVVYPRKLAKGKHAVVRSWIHDNHLALIEQATKDTTKALMDRGKPILYVMLAGTNDQITLHADLLEGVANIAKEHYGKITFASAAQLDAAPLIEFLRCAPDEPGSTYAVLHDPLHEYIYCIPGSRTEPISVDRLQDTLLQFNRGALVPDKLQSQPVPPPDENVGPLYTLVGDTLEAAVMDPERDVIVHIYGKIDKEWEDQEYALEKLALKLEDVPTIYIGLLDGIQNEKPASLPELGYFPCTWMWPAGAKDEPVRFNSTMVGFGADVLLEWIREHATHEFELEGDDGLHAGAIGDGDGDDDDDDDDDEGDDYEDVDAIETHDEL